MIMKTLSNTRSGMHPEIARRSPPEDSAARRSIAEPRIVEDAESRVLAMISRTEARQAVREARQRRYAFANRSPYPPPPLEDESENAAAAYQRGVNAYRIPSGRRDPRRKS